MSSRVIISLKTNRSVLKMFMAFLFEASAPLTKKKKSIDKKVQELHELYLEGEYYININCLSALICSVMETKLLSAIQKEVM